VTIDALMVTITADTIAEVSADALLDLSGGITLINT
jgi:hypothetical protein